MISRSGYPSWTALRLRISAKSKKSKVIHLSTTTTMVSKSNPTMEQGMVVELNDRYIKVMNAFRHETVTNSDVFRNF